MQVLLVGHLDLGPFGEGMDEILNLLLHLGGVIEDELGLLL